MSISPMNKNLLAKFNNNLVQCKNFQLVKIVLAPTLVINFKSAFGTEFVNVRKYRLYYKTNKNKNCFFIIQHIFIHLIKNIKLVRRRLGLWISISL